MLLNNRINRKYAIVFLVAVLSWHNSPCQAVIDWKDQVAQSVLIDQTPRDPSEYLWTECPNLKQGVRININPTETKQIFVEERNCVFSFADFRFTGQGGLFSNAMFTSIKISINNQSFFSIFDYNSNDLHAVSEVIWDGSSSFTEVGTYHVELKIQEFNSLYTRSYTIKVVPKSDKLFFDNYNNSIRVWKSGNPNAKPIVLSPGFDAYNLKPEQYYRYAGNELFNCFLSNGFDIYVLCYKFNAQDLRNNAAIYSSAIQFISSNYYNNQDIISAGISMGGLITRYSLAKAEHTNSPLPVDTWISLDAPHQGAYINIELQEYLKEKNEDSYSAYANNNDAAKIMLQYNAYDVGGVLKQNFYNDLYSLNGNGGFPKKAYSIGVSFSTADPNPDSGMWLKIEAPILLFFTLTKRIYLEDTEMQAGSYMPPLNIDPRPILKFGGAFFSTATITQLKNPAFMPHKSTLDYDEHGNTKFDNIIIPAETGSHDQIPSDIIPRIVDGVIQNVTKIQNKTLNGNISILAKNGIVCGYNVTDEWSYGNVVVSNNANVLFESGNYIEFKPGFSVMYGATIETKINTPFYQCNSEYYSIINSNDYFNDNISVNSNKNIEESECSYPNPCNNVLYVCINTKRYNKITCVSMDNSGRIIDKSVAQIIDESHIKYETAFIEPGLYYLSFYCEDTLIKTIKFIKQ